MYVDVGEEETFGRSSEPNPFCIYIYHGELLAHTPYSIGTIVGTREGARAVTWN